MEAIISLLQYQMSERCSLLQFEMEGLSCHSCQGVTNEFTILNCDHVFCAECLYGEIKTSLNRLSSIRCPCGQVTTFQSTKPLMNQTKITANTSPKYNNSRVLKTESSNMSVRSSMRERRSSMEKLKGGQISCEIQFLEVIFRKQMEEAENNFRRIVDCIKTKFDNLVKNIKLFWLEEKLEAQQSPLLQLPKLLMQKYKKTVGSKVHRINDAILQQLTTIRLDTESGLVERLVTQVINRDSREYHSIGKENKARHNIIFDQRDKLLRQIQQLKEEKMIKKVRRSQKYKFN